MSNEIYRNILMPVNTAFSTVNVMCNFALIRTYHVNPWYINAIVLGTSLFTAVFWLQILSFSSKLCSKSKGTVSSWTNISYVSKSEWKYVQKVKRSCRPLHLDFGSFYFITSFRVYQFAHTLLWGTLRFQLLVP